MNIKNLLPTILASFFIFVPQFAYSSNDQNQVKITSQNDSHTISENQEQYNAEIKKFIEETLQIVSGQTEKILYCLQQAEQIINSEKMKIDTSRVSKSHVLQEIKAVKEVIHFFESFYQDANKIPKAKAIEIGVYLNKSFLDFLLPIIKSDITAISADQFDQFLEKRLMDLQHQPQDPMLLLNMMDENEANIAELISACDNIGLNFFNKMYRFLDTQSIPLYGKSTLATAYDLCKWTALAGAVYSVGVFCLPKSMSLYGTWKEYKEQADQAAVASSPEDQTLEELLKHQFGAQKKAEQPKPMTWESNGKQYTRWTAADLPGKAFLGDFMEADRAMRTSIDSEAKKLEQNFGAGSYTYTASQYIANPTLSWAASQLAYQILPSLKDASKAAKKQFNDWVNYYGRGNNKAKDSQDFTKAYFKDMIGGDHLEQLAHQLADYLKNPTRYERAGIEPSVGYLLVGPPQTGKSFFARALKTLVEDTFEGQNEKVKFWNVTADDVKYWQGFANIFAVAKKHAPIILFIDEIDMYNLRRVVPSDNTNVQELLTCMNGVETDPSKKVIVVAATNRPEELDGALKEKGRFGNIITFERPNYECRKQYLTKQLAKRNIEVSQEMIETITQETDQQTYNMIDDIIKQTLQLATFKMQPVQESDFEVTLDQEIRKIKPNISMSAAERQLVATYQAGQAVARHVLSTDQRIVKITIETVDKAIKTKEGLGFVNEQKHEHHENMELLPAHNIKPTRLGFVFTSSNINNHELLSDQDQENEIMALLAGQAALELVQGKTFNSFGKEDRAKVLDMIERKISQGTPVTDTMRLQAIATKDRMYAQVKAVLQKHVGLIKTITDELIKVGTLDKKQWNQLVANYKI